MIRVDVLGGLRVSDAERLHAELAHQPMRAALLVMLAVDRSLTRERILSMLWPERDGERGRRALNQTVYELRRALGESAILVSGDRVSAGDQLVSDVAAFQEAAARADRAAALELYRGPFLSGYFLAPTNEFEDWCARHRSRLARLERKLRIELVDELAEAGLAREALPYAQRAVEDDPLEDDFQHRLIALLVTAGQRGEALRHFEAYRAALAAQGLEPLEHTRELIAAIRTLDGQLPPIEAAPPVESAPAAAPPVEAAPPPVADDVVPAAAAVRRPRRVPMIRLAAAALLLLAIGASAFWFLRDGRPGAPMADLAARPAPQLAIILFEDLSPDPRYAYLARGLTESLVDVLQRRLPRVRVVAFDDAAARAAAVTPGNAGSDAMASLRLDGSLTVQGDSVRVRVRLVDLATGVLLRPIEVRRTWNSELALIDGIVPAVVEQLRPVLGQHLRRLELRQGTRSPEAFALYLRAMEAGDAAERLAAAEDYRGADRLLSFADSLLENAGRADPEWSRTVGLRARLGRSHAFAAAALEHDIAAPRARALLQQALRHADIAVEREPYDADALAARGAIRFAMSTVPTPEGRPNRQALSRRAEADLHRAVSADPLAAEAWVLLSSVHYAGGEFAKALAAARQAHQADAFLDHQTQILQHLFLAAFQLRRDDEARRWCDEANRTAPTADNAVLCRIMLGAFARNPDPDALASALAQTHSFPHFTSAARTAELFAAMGYARAGLADRALALLPDGHSDHAIDDAPLRAGVLAALGRSDEAVALIAVYDRRLPDDLAALRARWLDPIRSHPGFPR